MVFKPLLIKEIDPLKSKENMEYIRENFRRVEQGLLDSGSAAGDIVQNITASSGSNVWVEGTAIVNPSTTIVMDTVALVDFFSVKYIISIYNDANALTKKVELTIIKTGSTLTDSISARIGTGNVTVSAIVVGLNMEVKLTNNEAFRVDVDFAKLDF